MQHLQLTLEYYNFLLNWTPNFFQAILRKIIFRLRHSLISKEMSSVDPNWKSITCMYKVQILWENHKILKKESCFDFSKWFENKGGYIFKFCGFLSISELYHCRNVIKTKSKLRFQKLCTHKCFDAILEKVLTSTHLLIATEMR